ncbi:MAG: hypothetical protein JNM79_01665 [Burkholderiales bacterium]|nr:hypothetical protein [Burkholderiales bacterium]
MSKSRSGPGGRAAAPGFEETIRSVEAHVTATSNELLETMVRYALIIATPESVAEVVGLIKERRLDPELTVRRVAIPGGWQVSVDLVMVDPATGEPMARLLRWTGNGRSPACVH